jgi:hypothetical protein
MVEDRRALGAVNQSESAERLLMEDFDTRGITGYYLCSESWRSGVVILARRA